ncbi:MAG: DUF1823 family protein [Cyanobacteria bacterium J06648_11]
MNPEALPDLSEDTVRAILDDRLDDDTVNALVWRSLGFVYDAAEERWDSSQAIAPWTNDEEPPHFTGSRPATVKLTRATPKKHKQLLKEQLNFSGYRVAELTPRKTRRATAANWLLHVLADQS